MAWGAAPISGSVLGPVHREGSGESRAIHGSPCEENRGGDGKLTRADRRTSVQTKCNEGGFLS
jgi:hypothetical protein